MPIEGMIERRSRKNVIVRREVLVFETVRKVARTLKRNKVNTRVLFGEVLQDFAEQQVVWYPNSGRYPAIRLRGGRTARVFHGSDKAKELFVRCFQGRAGS